MEIVSANADVITQSISEPDRGIYDAMNKGIQLAKGEIIGFLHSDDVFYSEDVLSTVATAFDDPKIDATYGDLLYVDREEYRESHSQLEIQAFFTRPFLQGLDACTSYLLSKEVQLRKARTLQHRL